MNYHDDYRNFCNHLRDLEVCNWFLSLPGLRLFQERQIDLAPREKGDLGDHPWPVGRVLLDQLGFTSPPQPVFASFPLLYRAGLGHPKLHLAKVLEESHERITHLHHHQLLAKTEPRATVEGQERPWFGKPHIPSSGTPLTGRGKILRHIGIRLRINVCSEVKVSFPSSRSFVAMDGDTHATSGSSIRCLCQRGRQ